MFSLPVTGRALGYYQITVTGTAATLPAPPAGAKMAYIVVESHAVRWRDDGVPAFNVGMPIPVNGDMVYNGPLSLIQFVAQTGTALLNVSYYG